MGMRGLGVALALAVAGALVGAVGGYAVGHLARDEPVAIAQAGPVPASDPSLPVDPEEPFAPDIDYPPLETDLSYQKHTLGDPPFAWVYRAPRGWQASQEYIDEIRWRPPDEPTVGGYSLRVKLPTEHKTPEQMVRQKLRAVRAGYQDVHVLGRTRDLLSFSYRDPGNDTQRFNTFQWFAAPGETVAQFEMSVVGRAVDQPGLDDLLDQVARRVAKVQ